MKKAISMLLAGIIALSAVPALAASKKEYTRCNYTLDTEGVTVLQNEEDRNITPSASALEVNPIIEGESPTTGMPYDTTQLYLPMLVQISNPTDGKINKKATKAAGTGTRSPWGGEYADIVYEAILYRYGVTRLTFLFSDSFEDGEPTSVGPIRSARLGHVRLREEWGGGIIFFGGPQADNNNVKKYFKELGATEKGVVFDLMDNKKAQNECWERVKLLAAPDNVNANVVAMRALVPETTVATPHPFLFSDESPYTDGYELVYSINLDWGHESYVSHLYYDETENLYLRYSGKYPYMTWSSADTILDEDTAEQMSFSNVIIQRCEYEYVGNNELMPDMQSVGKGNADIFIGGRYIPGYWVRESLDSPTIYLDDKGEEIVLTRGKTYIAQMPVEALCTYSEELTMPE